MVEDITPQQAYEAWQASNGGITLLDVREPNEWTEEGNIAGSMRLPMSEIQARYQAELPDQNAQVLVLCRSGGRSSQVAAFLKGMGYTNVKNISGGIQAWGTAKLPMRFTIED